MAMKCSCELSLCRKARKMVPQLASKINNFFVFQSDFVSLLRRQEVYDARFNGLDRGIYATTRESKYLDFCN